MYKILFIISIIFMIFLSVYSYPTVIKPRIFPTPTPTFTPTPTVSPTPSPSPSPTPSPTPTPTPIPTPTHTPTPTIIPVSSEQLDQWFTNSSNHYSVDRTKLWKIAVCESNLRTNATNGDYAGLYQFSTSTWISTRGAMNMDSNPSLRFNAEESIRTAAYKISVAGTGSWPACGVK